MLWRHRAAGDQWRAAGSPRSGSADQYRICCLVFFLWIWSLVFRSLPRHHRRNAAAVAKSAAPQSYRYTSFRFPPRHRNKKRCRCRSAVPSLRGRGAEPPCARSQNNRSKSNCHPQAFRAGPQLVFLSHSTKYLNFFLGVSGRLRENDKSERPRQGQH